ncbi:MAG: hypothetical protein IPO31_08085 [Candidatus Obscuribacter sp.]|nr:hypothetical protein [Candidatus Obscuribacter sp.]
MSDKSQGRAKAKSHYASASLLACTLATSAVLTGCITTSSTTLPSEPTAKPANNPDNPIQQCNSANPGPYKESTIGDAQVMLSRYPLGEFGGTLKRSLVMADPKTFNYWEAADTVSRELGNLMFASLLETDPYTGEIVPGLAESYTVSPDNLTYTVTLRKGLKWSDGKPITSADVVYTWNTLIKDGFGNSSLRDVTQVDGKSPEVKAVDDLTVTFKTAKPFAPFIRVLGLPLAPKHIVEPVTSQKDGQKAFHGLWGVNSKPKSFVTSGPFTLEQYTPSQRVEFKRTKNYYLFNEQNKALPYLEHLSYQVVPDVNTNLLKFKGKEIDMTTVRCRDAGDLAREAKAGNFKLYDFGPSFGSTFICFNLNQRKDKNNKPYVDPIKSAWFNDVNFRQAINHGINRDNIVANYFKGLGLPAFTAETPDAPFRNTELKPFARDINYSKELLKKSGFTWDKDGKLHDKNGNKVEFDLLTSAGGTFYSFVGTAFRTDMADLGIKVNFSEINGNTLNDKVMTALDWQAILFSLSGDPTEPNDSANVYKSKSRLHIFDQRLADEKNVTVANDVRPWEAEIDKLMEEGAQTLDKAERKKIYGRVQAILFEQAPFIYLAAPKTIVGVRNTVKNFYPTPLSQPNIGLHNLPEVWVK